MGMEVMGIVEPLALVANAKSTDCASIGPALEGSWGDTIVLGYLGAGHKGVNALLEEPAVLGSDVGAVTWLIEPWTRG